MNEERKDENVRLTDEAVEEATGGSFFDEIQNGEKPKPPGYTCPNCQFVFFFTRSVLGPPPTCPQCGYPVDL